MIQNSLSPVVKSRISSPSGSTISVENRTLARTWTISCREYFTVRAAPASATAGLAETTRQSMDKIGRLLRTDLNFVRIGISFLLMCTDFGIIETWIKLTGDF